MALRKCCIENCNSSSIRPEDEGVTYHKYPKDTILYDIWLKVTKNNKQVNVISYVCSRHFRELDFEHFQDSKYILKSDAVPSIFPWNMDLKEHIGSESKDLDIIGVVQMDEKIIDDKSVLDDISIETTEKSLKDNILQENLSNKMNKNSEDLSTGEPSTFIDFVWKEESCVEKNIITPHDKGKHSMALSVGSRVEARDYEEHWCSASIVEVDYDEMEVLVHYDDAVKRQDEWINVASPRLRPYVRAPKISTEKKKQSYTKPVIEEMSHEREPKRKFEIGERCLARWKNNGRFIATVHKHLPNGKYEVLFDDGVMWTSSESRLLKINSESHEDSPLQDRMSSDTAPRIPNTTTPGTSSTNYLAHKEPFHKHLFDPTRDYLGSKSERREMKRKLNIKALFNIGQTNRGNSGHKNKKMGEKNKRVSGSKSSPGVNEKIINRRQSQNSTTKKNSTLQLVIKDIYKQPKEETITKYDNEGSIELNDNVNNDPKSSPEPDEKNFQSFEEINKEQHEEKICKIKDAIIKLEDGLNMLEKAKEEEAMSVEIKKEKEECEDIEINEEHGEDKIESKESDVSMVSDEIDTKDGIETVNVKKTEEQELEESKKKERLNKIKRAKKLRLLREKRVQAEVQKVKSELEEMWKRFNEMKEQVRIKEEGEMANAGPKSAQTKDQNNEFINRENFLLPGEWCCKWVNGMPQGVVYDMECDAKDSKTKRCAIKVEDNRLPPLWVKVMLRRNVGTSAGKWDVMLLSPDKKKFHTKSEMKAYLDTVQDDSLKPYEEAMLDFSIHRKLSRRMGWDDQAHCLVDNDSKEKSLKRKLKFKENLKKKKRKHAPHKNDEQMNISIDTNIDCDGSKSNETPLSPVTENAEFTDPETGERFVYVGSLKVQILQNLLRCPADGCYKNFRNNTLLRMHIKHYHKELKRIMGDTPKVSDLAYARAETELNKEAEVKAIKLKIAKVKRPDAETRNELPDNQTDNSVGVSITNLEQIPRSLDSPKLRKALINNKPLKRPRVLLPVRKSTDGISPTDESPQPENIEIESPFKEEFERKYCAPQVIENALDFETGITVHTVPKAISDKKKKKLPVLNKARASTASEEDDWGSDFETRSSFPGSATPDSKNYTPDYRPDIMNQTVDTMDMRKEGELYYTSETGERIKIVRMKREEIINCHCGIREEDGLMIQCELCLCWQHAMCHNIHKEAEVPEKYTCSICLNPRRGRRSQRFLHDQDRLYEGLLPGARPDEALRRSHELSGNLHRIHDALHALKIKYLVATKKNHPKLYLWAKDWESNEINDKFPTDFADLSSMMTEIGKDNLPLKTDDLIRDISFSDIRMPDSINEDLDEQRLSQRSDASLSNLFSSSGVGALELPISTTELESLAKSVQAECELTHVAPQPEPPIENSACRERLLRHIQRCQTLIDSRLDSIEAQVAELESQDPSFEDDETADFFPRTKQTIEMLLRDLDTMEELGVIT